MARRWLLCSKPIVCGRHRIRDGPRSRYRNLLPVIRTVRLVYADLPAAQFSPKKLKTVRQVFIEKG